MSDWSEVASGAVGGGLVIAVQTLKSAYTSRRDRNKIFRWLEAESKQPGKFEYRSTRAIAKAVSLTPDRVLLLCHTDVRIHAALGDRDDLWNLSGEDQKKPMGMFD